MFVAKFVEVKTSGEEVTRKRRFDDVDKARMWLLSEGAPAFSPYLRLHHYGYGFVEMCDKATGDIRFGLSLYNDTLHDYVSIL